ncbi:MAG: ABC transporter permease, partial [Gammaproteobacteria bacterium]
MMRRLLAVLHARNLEFLRDRQTLVFTLLLPVMLVIGMGFVFGGPQRPLFKVGLLGDASDPLAHPFLSERYVEFIRLPQQGEALRKLTHQQID